MIIEIRTQKNGTILLTAPDGTVYPYKPLLDGTAEETAASMAALCSELGRDMMEILTDTTQPAMTTTPTVAHTPAAAKAKAEENAPPPGEQSPMEQLLRGALENFMPGASGLLDKMQDASSDEG